jgi:predicted AAA+ superfamily ATPase
MPSAPHPRRLPPPDFDAADAFVWHPEGHRLQPVARVSRVDLSLLRGVDRMRDILLDNTERFARGLPANNVLLWGARGMGKSSLVKAAHAPSSPRRWRGSSAAKLIEIHREDIETLPRADGPPPRRPGARDPLFCDDLSFDGDDTSYKSLKAVLEGGIEGRPENVVFYATSNRRHLLPRDMMENERSTAINPGEAVEEKVSLSDRFGLWLGFHKCSQDEYLAMVRGYVDHFGLRVDGGRTAARCAGMGDHPRRSLGPRRLAVCPGPRRPARRRPEIATARQRVTPVAGRSRCCVGSQVPDR